MTLTYKQKLTIFHDNFVKYAWEYIERQKAMELGQEVIAMTTPFREVVGTFRLVPIAGFFADVGLAVSDVLNGRLHATSISITSLFPPSARKIKEMLSLAIQEVAVHVESYLNELEDQRSIGTFATDAVLKLVSYLKIRNVNEKTELKIEEFVNAILIQKGWFSNDKFVIRTTNESENYFLISEEEIRQYITNERQQCGYILSDDSSSLTLVGSAEIFATSESANAIVQQIKFQNPSIQDKQIAVYRAEHSITRYITIGNPIFVTDIDSLRVTDLEEIVVDVETKLHKQHLMLLKHEEMIQQNQLEIQVFQERETYQKSIQKEGEKYFFNIPKRVEQFIGRKAQLLEMHEYFMSYKNGIQVIGGLGGVGKTQTVLQYIKIYGEVEYNFRVRWINADGKLPLDIAFREFAQTLGMVIDKESEEEIRDWVKLTLAKDIKKTLLFFDNVKNYEMVINYLPDEGLNQHHVIIATSNIKDWEDGAGILGVNVIRLAPFSDDEVKSFSAVYIKEESTEDSLALAKLYDNIPLGLSHSSTYIRIKGINIKLYLAKHHSFKAMHPTKFPEVMHSSKFDPHIENVYITIQILLNELAQNDNDAYLLFLLCSYLHSNDIPKYLFDSKYDDIKLSSYISVLSGYSLVSISVKEDLTFLSVHKIVQEVTRIEVENLGKTLQLEILETIMGFMSGYIQSEQKLFFNGNNMLLHKYQLIEHYENTREDNKIYDAFVGKKAAVIDKHAIFLVFNCAMIRLCSGRYYKAIEDYKKVLTLSNEVSDNELVVDTKVQLGYCYHIIGDHEEALKYLEKVVKDVKDEKFLTSIYSVISSANFALSRPNMAQYYLSKINFEAHSDSEELAKLRTIFTKLYKGDYSFIMKSRQNEVVISGNNQNNTINQDSFSENDILSDIIKGQLSLFEGKSKTAIHKFNKLSEDIKTISNDHCMIPHVMFLTGMTYSQQNRHQEAIAIYEKALLEEDDKAGETRLSAFILQGIAAEYRELGLLSEALEKFYLALERFEKIYKYDDRHVANILLNIGFLYAQMKRYKESVDYLERSEKAYVNLKNSGDNSINVFINMLVTTKQKIKLHQITAISELILQEFAKLNQQQLDNSVNQEIRVNFTSFNKKDFIDYCLIYLRFKPSDLIFEGDFCSLYLNKATVVILNLQLIYKEKIDLSKMNDVMLDDLKAEDVSNISDSSSLKEFAINLENDYGLTEVTSSQEYFKFLDAIIEQLKNTDVARTEIFRDLIIDCALEEIFQCRIELKYDIIDLLQKLNTEVIIIRATDFEKPEIIQIQNPKARIYLGYFEKCKNYLLLEKSNRYNFINSDKVIAKKLIEMHSIDSSEAHIIKTIGPRTINGFLLDDVKDDGNCFYLAVIKQMRILKHSFIRDVPVGTESHNSLRLHLQGPAFSDREWANDSIFDVFVREFPDIILAIVDTRNPAAGFIAYYLNEEGDVVTNTGEFVLPTNKLIIRLAATGNHFLSVRSHPEINNGVLHDSYKTEVNLHLDSILDEEIEYHRKNTKNNENSVILDKNDSEKQQASQESSDDPKIQKVFFLNKVNYDNPLINLPQLLSKANKLIGSDKLNLLIALGQDTDVAQALIQAIQEYGEEKVLDIIFSEPETKIDSINPDDQLLETISKIEIIIGKEALAALSGWHQYISKVLSNNPLSKHAIKVVQTISCLINNLEEWLDFGITYEDMIINNQVAIILAQLENMFDFIATGITHVGLPYRYPDFDPDDEPFGGSGGGSVDSSLSNQDNNTDTVLVFLPGQLNETSF